MSTARISIYKNDAINSAMEGRVSDSRGISATITVMLDRYAETVRRHTPALTLNQWHALLSVTQSWWTQDAASPQYLAMEIEDALDDDLAAEFSINGPALLRQIKTMGYAEKCAVLDVCERYWAGKRGGDMHKDLIGLGARFADG